MQGVWVQSLVGELRSHMPHGVAPPPPPQIISRPPEVLLSGGSAHPPPTLEVSVLWCYEPSSLLSAPSESLLGARSFSMAAGSSEPLSPSLWSPPDQPHPNLHSHSFGWPPPPLQTFCIPTLTSCTNYLSHKPQGQKTGEIWVNWG